MRWLVLLALSGCLILPKTETTTRSLGTYSTPTITGEAGPVRLQISEAYAQVHVRAVRARRCFREIRARMEERTEQTAHLVTGDVGNDAQAALAVAIISAPFTLVSGLITAGVVAADHPKVEHWDQTVDTLAFDCSRVAAGVGVELVLPSGTTLRASTDTSGTLAFAIPASEPPQGSVVVRSVDAAYGLTYSRDPNAPRFAPPSATPVQPVMAQASPPAPMPSESELRAVAQQQGFSGVRDALRACGRAQGVHGIVAAQLVIEGDGSAHANPDRGGVAFNTCVNGALASVRFPAGHQQHLVFPYQL